MSAKKTDAKVMEFLAGANIVYSVRLIGATTRDKWRCDEWRVLFKGPKAEFKTEYFTGTGHRVDTAVTAMQRRSLKGCSVNSVAWQEMLKGMKPVQPSAASVLYSLLLDSSAVDQSFIDWCNDLGYETDSRKALATYEACCESGQKMRQLFTSAQRETLAELLQDY